MDSVADCPGMCPSLPLPKFGTDEAPRHGETTSSMSPSICLPRQMVCCARSSRLHQTISSTFIFRSAKQCFQKGIFPWQ